VRARRRALSRGQIFPPVTTKALRHEREIGELAGIGGAEVHPHADQARGHR